MKRKRLTIVLFSVIMLAATPRAMSYFNNYADALHHQAETEWLRFLLSFGTPAENDAGPTSQKDQQEVAPCTDDSESPVQSVAGRSRVEAATNSRPIKSRSRSIEFSFTESPSLPTDLKKGIAAELFRFDLEKQGHDSRKLAPPANPVAAHRNGVAKAKSDVTIARVARLREKRVARSLAREFAGMNMERAIPAFIQRVRFEQTRVQALDAEPESVDRETTDHKVVPEDTMR